MKKRKITIHEALRDAVFARDGERCRYCGSTQGPFWIDHVYPESKGGATVLDNLVVACRTCNINKGWKIGIWPKTDRPVYLSYPAWCIVLTGWGGFAILLYLLIGLLSGQLISGLLIVGFSLSITGFVCEKAIDNLRSKVNAKWSDYDEN